MNKIKPVRQVTPAGITLLKHLECKKGEPNLIGYLDERGTPTAGYGHTGPDVSVGARYTLEQAERWLDEDLDEVEFALCKYTAYTQFNDNQFDALALLLYNTGVGALFAENFSKAIATDPATGRINFALLAKQFPKWVWITDETTKKKRVSQGLVNRRAAELVLFNTPVALPQPAPAPQALPGPAAIPPYLPKPPAVDVASIREAAPVPAVPPPVIHADRTPVVPPSTVAATPGGKSFLVTIGGVIVTAITQGYDQIVDVATQVSKVKDGIADAGTWGHIAGVAVCVGIVGIALVAYWARHKEVKKNAG